MDGSERNSLTGVQNAQVAIEAVKGVRIGDVAMIPLKENSVSPVSKQSILIVISQCLTNDDVQILKEKAKIIFFFRDYSSAEVFYRTAMTMFDIFFVADYSRYDDGLTGFRIIKKIRDFEIENGAHKSKIYLMIDDPKTDETFAIGCGATGFIRKTPSDIISKYLDQKEFEQTIPPVLVESKSVEIVPSPRGYSAELQNEIIQINLALYKCIGETSNIVINKANDMVMNGQIGNSKAVYIEYLCTQIPSDEMKDVFTKRCKKLN